MKNRLIALLAGYGLVLILLIVTGVSPGDGLTRLFAGPFMSLFSFGDLINIAGLLVITGCAVALAFQSGDFNLGGEGQAYMGALFAALSGLALEGIPGIAGIPLYLLAGAAGGFIPGLFSGLLKRYTGTDILISSYLLSGGIIVIISFLVAGPLREEASYLLSTRPIATHLRIPRLLPHSNAHTGLVSAPVIAFLVWFFLNRTIFGYELRLQGFNRNFARYGGIPTGRYDIWPLAASGLLHGFAGALVVGGNHFACLQGGTAGLGWNGIGAALIGANRPELILPAAFFLGHLLKGIESTTLFSRIPMETGFLIQGVLFLIITAKRKKR